MKKVAVVGLGKAGLPLAAVIAASGREVVGIDVDQTRCDQINRGINPIPEETGLDELLAAHGGKQLTCTSRYDEYANLIESYIVIVPLFIDPNHQPDFHILDKAFASLRGVLKKGDSIILETTVPPGTLENRFKPILDQARVPYCLGYSPERIMTGYSISRYREFPKVVAGIDAESLRRIQTLYSGFCKRVVPVSTLRTAELVKVCEGVFRDTNIALANEIHKACVSVGVDFWELREAANHAFCQIHEPGIVGGHCIPVYPYFFLETFESPLVRTARNLNEELVDATVEACLTGLRQLGRDPNRSAVALLGITYRDGVASDYLSPALMVAEKLRPAVKELLAWDALFSKSEIEQRRLRYLETPSQADYAIVFHGGPAMKTFLASAMPPLRREQILDMKHCLESFRSPSE